VATALINISTTSNANLRCCLVVIDQLLFLRCKQSVRLPSFAGFIESRGLGICWLGCWSSLFKILLSSARRRPFERRCRRRAKETSGQVGVLVRQKSKQRARIGLSAMSFGCIENV